MPTLKKQRWDIRILGLVQRGCAQRLGHPAGESKHLLVLNCLNAAIAGFGDWGNPGLHPTFLESASSWEHDWGLASLLPLSLAWPKEPARRPGSHQPGSMSPHASPTAFLHTLTRGHGSDQG